MADSEGAIVVAVLETELAQSLEASNAENAITLAMQTNRLRLKHVNLLKALIECCSNVIFKYPIVDDR